MAAKVVWETLMREFPEYIGKVNPYNQEIERLFGDQGGY
jgi:hypothetical protein